MKKRARILSTIIILIIIILIPFLSLNLTGFSVQEPQKQIQFYFYDEATNCPLNGYVFTNNKPIGKSENGIFILEYNNYITNFKDNQDISIFGELGDCFENSELYFNKYWTLPEIKEYNFLGDSLFNFKTNINPNNPTKKELQGFIQAKKVNKELENININTNSNTLNDLSKINTYLNNQITYKDDWAFEKETNYWQTPKETLEIQKGDCEDFSTTLLSLFLTYNNKLNCYNIVFSSHVTTFCHFNDYYAYYDQGKTKLIKEIPNHNQKTKSRLEQLNQDYFEHYELNLTEAIPHYAFNDQEFIEFKTNQDFIEWQYNLKNTKTQSNLFKDIEDKITQNTENLPDTNLKDGELRTQTIALPSSKQFPLFIFLLSITLIIIIFAIIIINKKRKKRYIHQN